MNIGWEIFRTGGAMVVRTVYLRGGRRIVVVDRAKKVRAAIRALAAKGHTPGEITVLIGRPVDFVVALLV
ncbi:hypothetical protein [Paracoccus sp. KR1-242]|uniref:hypothetical protein n=1 Tax=Paracoccus sp. KR1-242 TaxID=3410028 RepID=UPI003C10533A